MSLVIADKLLMGDDLRVGTFCANPGAASRIDGGPSCGGDKATVCLAYWRRGDPARAGSPKGTGFTALFDVMVDELFD